MTHPLQKQYQAQVHELVLASVRSASLGYVSSHGGNLSVRVAEDIVLITPTKVPKRDMTETDICFVNMRGETLFAPEGRRPTSESPFHLRVFEKRPDLKGIVHAHPPILTGFAIAGGDLLRRPFLPEPVIEIGPMIVVPYAQPGSEALAEAFDAALPYSNGFLMENHGVLICGIKDIIETVEQLQMAEAMAQSVLTAKLLGNLNVLSEKEVSDLEDVLKIRGLKAPGGGTSLSGLFR